MPILPFSGASGLSQTNADIRYVKKTGDTMSGSLQQIPSTGIAGFWLNALPASAGTASRLSSYSASLPALALRAGVTLPISNKALTSNVATITTAAAHGYANGRSVIIEGLGSPFDGTYTVTGVPTGTTFTYAKTAGNVASTPVTIGTGYAGNEPFSAGNEPPALTIEDSTGIERLRIVGDDGRLLWVVSGVSGGVSWQPSTYSTTGIFTTGAVLNPSSLLIGSGGSQAIFSTAQIAFNGGTQAISLYASAQFNFNVPARFPGIAAGGLVGGATLLAIGEFSAVSATDKVIVARGAASQSANLQEWQDSTGAILAKVDKSGNITAPNLITILSTTTAINAKTVANTALYTVPTSKTAVITGYTVRVSAASAITIGPAAGLGNISGTNNISASQAMNGLTGTTTSFQWTVNGMSLVTAAAGVIYFNIGTAATGTSETVVVDLWGYTV